MHCTGLGAEEHTGWAQAAQGGDPAAHALFASPVKRGGTPAHAGRGGPRMGGSPRRAAHIADLLASKELLLACFSMARERVKP